MYAYLPMPSPFVLYVDTRVPHQHASRANSPPPKKNSADVTIPVDGPKNLVMKREQKLNMALSGVGTLLLWGGGIS